MDEVIEDNFPLKKKHVQSAPKIKHSIVPPKSKGKKVPVPSKPSTKVPSSDTGSVASAVKTAKDNTSPRLIKNDANKDEGPLHNTLQHTSDDAETNDKQNRNMESKSSTLLSKSSLTDETKKTNSENGVVNEGDKKEQEGSGMVVMNALIERHFKNNSFSSIQRYHYMEPHSRMHQALEMLHHLSEFDNDISYSEFHRTRLRLRQFILKAHEDKRFNDALSEAIVSLRYSKAFYQQETGHGLTGDMILELFVICHCTALMNDRKEGLPYLNELRYIVESTLRQFAEQTLPKLASEKDKQVVSQLNSRGFVQAPIIKCDGTVLCQILCRVAELCYIFEECEAADIYYNKFVLLADKIYGDDSVYSSDARNILALFYYNTRRYNEALMAAQQALDIRKKKFGDFWKVPPHYSVAESYSNVALLLRLTGKIDSALNYFIIALDMQLRIHNLNRNTQQVQDILLCTAIIYHQLSRFREAMEMYSEVYTYRCTSLGKNHPDTKHVLELQKQLEEDIKVAQQVLIKEKVSNSPRGTREGLFIDGIFGPGFLCRTSRKQMLLRSLKSDDMEMKSPRNMSWIDSVASRVDGLYGDCIVASSIPSTFIPPFVFTESIGPDILSLSAAMDCLDIHKPPARPCLPVINIPNVSFGVPHLIKNGKSISFCLSEAARTLYKKWGVPECSVDEETGEVVKKDLHDFPFSIPLALPLWDTKSKSFIKGMNGFPLMVPNVIIPHIYYKKNSDSSLSSSDSSSSLYSVSSSSDDDSGLSTDSTIQVIKPRVNLRLSSTSKKTSKVPIKKNKEVTTKIMRKSNTKPDLRNNLVLDISSEDSSLSDEKTYNSPQHVKLHKNLKENHDASLTKSFRRLKHGSSVLSSPDKTSSVSPKSQSSTSLISKISRRTRKTSFNENNIELADGKQINSKVRHESPDKRQLKIQPLTRMSFIDAEKSLIQNKLTITHEVPDKKKTFLLGEHSIGEHLNVPEEDKMSPVPFAVKVPVKQPMSTFKNVASIRVTSLDSEGTPPESPSIYISAKSHRGESPPSKGGKLKHLGKSYSKEMNKMKGAGSKMLNGNSFSKELNRQKILPPGVVASHSFSDMLQIKKPISVKRPGHKSSLANKAGKDKTSQKTPNMILKNLFSRVSLSGKHQTLLGKPLMSNAASKQKSDILLGNPFYKENKGKIFSPLEAKNASIKNKLSTVPSKKDKRHTFSIASRFFSKTPLHISCLSKDTTDSKSTETWSVESYSNEESDYLELYRSTSVEKEVLSYGCGKRDTLLENSSVKQFSPAPLLGAANFPRTFVNKDIKIGYRENSNLYRWIDHQSIVTSEYEAEEFTESEDLFENSMHGFGNEISRQVMDFSAPFRGSLCFKRLPNRVKDVESEVIMSADKLWRTELLLGKESVWKNSQAKTRKSVFSRNKASDYVSKTPINKALDKKSGFKNVKMSGAFDLKGVFNKKVPKNNNDGLPNRLLDSELNKKTSKISVEKFGKKKSVIPIRNPRPITQVQNALPNVSDDTKIGSLKDFFKANNSTPLSKKVHFNEAVDIKQKTSIKDNKIEDLKPLSLSEQISSLVDSDESFFLNEDQKIVDREGREPHFKSKRHSLVNLDSLNKKDEIELPTNLIKSSNNFKSVNEAESSIQKKNSQVIVKAPKQNSISKVLKISFQGKNEEEKFTRKSSLLGRFNSKHLKKKKKKKKKKDLKQPVYKTRKPQIKIPWEIAEKAKAIKPCFETLVQNGLPVTVSCVTLVDEDGNDLLTLPWRVDLEDFLIAVAAISLFLSKRGQKFPNLKFLSKGPPDVFEQLKAGAGLESLKMRNDIWSERLSMNDKSLLNTEEAKKSLSNMKQMDNSSKFLLSANLLDGLQTNLLVPQIDTKSVEGKKASIKAKESEKSSPKRSDSNVKEASMEGQQGEELTGTILSKSMTKGPPKSKGGKIKGGPPLPKIASKPPKMAAGAKDAKAKVISKTKKLFWDPIGNSEGTVWEYKESIEIDKEALETAFAKTVPKAVKTTSSENKPKVLQILPDSKRSYNMSIALSRFNNYTFAKLRDAVLDLKPEILTLDATETLIAFTPLPEEIAVVEEYIKSGAELKLLDKSEQFVAAMLGVPLMQRRLECHRYALQFIDLYDSVAIPLSNIGSTIHELRNSVCLKVILSVVLEIGNTMNKGAEVTGFRLSTLNKLSDVRTVTTPVRTVLQYVIDVIFEKRPEALLLQKELPSLDKAARVEWAPLQVLVDQLEAGLEKIKATLEMAQKNNSENGNFGDRDPIVDIFPDFLAGTCPKVDSLKKSLSETKEKFKQLAIYFGEPEKSLDQLSPKTFFSELLKFVNDVEVTRKDRVDKAEREAKRQAAKQKAEALKNTAVSKKAVVTVKTKQNV